MRKKQAIETDWRAARLAPAILGVLSNATMHGGEEDAKEKASEHRVGDSTERRRERIQADSCQRDS
jgi:hypothetical protein